MVFSEDLPLLQIPKTSLPTLPTGLRENLESYFFPWCSHTVLEILRSGKISEALMPGIISTIHGNSRSQKWLFLLTLELSFQKPIWTWSPLCFFFHNSNCVHIFNYSLREFLSIGHKVLKSFACHVTTPLISPILYQVRICINNSIFWEFNYGSLKKTQYPVVVSLKGHCLSKSLKVFPFPPPP